MTPQDAIPDRKSWPDRQLWSQAAKDGLKPAEFGTFTTPLIRKPGPVAAVGTMLAAQLLGLMRKRFSPLRTEQTHDAFADIPPEAEEYTAFSAAYGEVWSARALRQLIERADRDFTPKEDRWRDGEVIVDPYRPGLLYPARSDQEFDLLLDRHLNAVRSVFRRCSTLIVALGASEICEAVEDGALIPAWPEAQPGARDQERYAFRTLTVAETIADLNAAIDRLRALNPAMAIVLMISPEPPVATATNAHIVAASAHGKAILRVAMDEVAGQPGVSYFPALEILATLGSAAFGADGRTLSTKAAGLVGSALIEASEGGSIEMTVPERPRSIVETVAVESPAAELNPEPEAPPPDTKKERARRKAEAAAEAEAPKPSRVVAKVLGEYTEPVSKRGGAKPRKLRLSKIEEAVPDAPVIRPKAANETAPAPTPAPPPDPEAEKRAAEKAAEKAARAEQIQALKDRKKRREEARKARQPVEREARSPEGSSAASPVTGKRRKTRTKSVAPAEESTAAPTSRRQRRTKSGATADKPKAATDSEATATTVKVRRGPKKRRETANQTTE